MSKSNPDWPDLCTNCSTQKWSLKMSSKYTKVEEDSLEVAKINQLQLVQKEWSRGADKRKALSRDTKGSPA